MRLSRAPAQRPLARWLSSPRMARLHRPALSMLMLADCPTIGLASGQSLVHQGEIPTTVYYLLAGIVKQVRLEDRGANVGVTLCHAGALIGHVGTVLSMRHEITAITLSAAEVAAIPAERFVRILQSDSGACRWVMKEIALANRSAIDQIGALGCLTPIRRISRILTQLQARANVPARASEVVLPALQVSDLADLAGVTREHASRCLARMEREGQIGRRKGRILLPVTSVRPDLSGKGPA